MNRAYYSDIYRDTGDLYKVSVYQTRNIITSYIKLQKSRLRQNIPVEFFGLCKIAKSRDTEIDTTLGKDAKIIARELSLPYSEVITILAQYIRALRERLRIPNTSVSITGIVTFRSSLGSGGKLCISSSKSENGYYNVRVFTSRFLKDMEPIV